MGSQGYSGLAPLNSTSEQGANTGTTQNTFFEERDTPYKGIGVFAICTIEPGTRVLSEEPLLALPDAEDVIACYRAVKALPSDKEAAFWALAGSTKPPRDTEWKAELNGSTDDDNMSFEDLVMKHEEAYSRFETNRFTLRGSNGSVDRLGVFPTAARTNHSCSPNVFHRFNPNINRLTMHALRTIQPGEEVCTSYIDICHDTTERRRLLRHWGFKCACDACRADDPAQNWRRAKIEQLMSRMQRKERRRIFEDWSESDYADALNTIEEMVGYMIEEGMEETDTLGEAFANAADYCLAIGWKQKAIELAERAMNVELKCCGEDSPDYETAAIFLESAVNE